MNSGIRSRIFITAGLLVAALAAAQVAERRGPPSSAGKPLREVPESMGPWTSVNLKMDAHMVNAVGVDDYLYRRYENGRGDQVVAYVGFYESQSAEKLIHSPKNCLPGAGWQEVRAGRLRAPVSASRWIETNEYLVVKDLQQLLVLYWFQGRGHAVASEYRLKIWNITDALLRNRSDGGLVRLSASTRQGETRAKEHLIEFLGDFYPQLEEVLPQ